MCPERTFEGLAGAPGFEPGNVGTKNRCLTTWRRPNSRAGARCARPYRTRREKAQCHDHAWTRLIHGSECRFAVERFGKSGTGWSVVGERPGKRRAVEGFDTVQRAAGGRQFQIVEFSVKLHRATLLHCVLVMFYSIADAGKSF